MSDRRVRNVISKYWDRQVRQAAKKDHRVGDSKFVGLFLPLPLHLANQFPSKEEDTSPPHVTFLVVGEVTEERKAEFLEIVHGVMGSVPGPVKARLGALGWFKNPASETSIAHTEIHFSLDLARYRAMLVGALRNAWFEVEDFSPDTWHPHATITYLETLEADRSYDGPVPEGNWAFNRVEIWGLSEPSEVSFGTRPPR